MQPFDIFQLALGIFWSLVTLYFLIGFLPGVCLHQQRWESRIKKRGGGKITPPSPLQRVVAVMLTGLMSAQVLANAFHHDFAKMTGISPSEILLLMVLLPALYVSLGILDRQLRKKHKPDA